MNRTGRRRFLRQTFLGSAALVAAPRFLPKRRQSQLAPEVARDLRFFNEEEYLTFSAAAARLTGHSPGETGPQDAVNPALRADHFLSTEDPEIQDQIHLLLTIFNSAIPAFIFNFSFSNFVNMDPAAQDRYLAGWMTSSLSFRRTAFQALKRLSMSMFYTDPGAWEEIGYHGMPLPGESR